MIIRMKYPKIDGDKLWDGTFHEIEPKKIFKAKFQGSEFFLLIYTDNKYQEECSTVLINNDGNFFKVPLRDYPDLYDKIDKGEIKLEKSDISILNDVSVIFNKGVINSIDKYNPIEHNIPDRRVKVQNVIKLVLDVRMWESKIMDIEEENLLNDAFNEIELTDLNMIPDFKFNLFIKELETRLNSCISVQDDGSVLLGPNKADVKKAVSIIRTLLAKYFNKTDEKKEQPRTIAQKASLPPLPPLTLHKNIRIPDNPQYQFLYLEREPESKPKNYFFKQDGKQYKCYAALKANSYNDVSIYTCDAKMYENENDEEELFFHNAGDIYNNAGLQYYLNMLEKGDVMFITPLVISYDLQKKCWFFGKNSEVESFSIEYNFAVCKDEEKFKEIFNSSLFIEIPEDCDYRGISRKSFIAQTFKQGIIGGYKLSTMFKTFEADPEKVVHYPFSESSKQKKI